MRPQLALRLELHCSLTRLPPPHQPSSLPSLPRDQAAHKEGVVQLHTVFSRSGTPAPTKDRK
jgi:hypothetical protein